METKNLKLGNMQFLVCHRRPDRSFFYRKKQFPVCARCTGTLIGFAALPLFSLKVLSFGLVWTLLLNVPAMIDGGTQAMGWRESNNWLRLITGIMLGMAQVGLAAICGDFIIQKLGLFEMVESLNL